MNPISLSKANQLFPVEAATSAAASAKAPFETSTAAKTANAAISAFEVDVKTTSSMVGVAASAAASATLGEQVSSIAHSLIHHDPSCYLLVKYLEKAPKEFNLPPSQLYPLIFKGNDLLVERLLTLKDDFTKLPQALLNIFSLPEVGSSIQGLNLKNKRIHAFEQFSKMFPNLQMFAFAGPYEASLAQLKNLKELHIEEIEDANKLPALPNLRTLTIKQLTKSYLADLSSLLNVIPEKYPAVDSLTLDGELSLKAVKPLLNIRKLDLSFCTLPNGSPLPASFPNLKELTAKNEQAIAELPHWPSLRALNISLSWKPLIELENLLNKNPQIEHLSVPRVITFEELNRFLKPLKQLSYLSIDLYSEDIVKLNAWLSTLPLSHPTLSQLEIKGSDEFQGLVASSKPKVRVVSSYPFDTLSKPLPKISNVDFTLEKREADSVCIRKESESDNHFMQCHGKAAINPLVDIFASNLPLASELIFYSRSRELPNFIWEALTHVGPNIRTFGSKMQCLEGASKIAPVVPNIETLYLRTYNKIDIAKLWPQLRVLHLRRELNSPLDIASLSSLAHLHTVQLHLPETTELEALATAKPTLRTLILDYGDISLREAQAIKKFTRLEALELSHSHFYNDSLKEIGTLSTLKRLALNHLFDPSGIFAGLNNLVSLDAGGLPAGSLAVVASQLPNLTEFDCTSNTGKSRDFIEKLAHFKKLTKLSIALNRTEDIGVLVEACPHLEELAIYNRLNVDGAMQLCNLKKLKRLKCEKIYSHDGEEKKAALMKTLESQGCKVEFRD